MVRALQDRDRGYRSLMRDLKSARAGGLVHVGIQGDQAAAQKQVGEGEESTPLTLVEVAAIQEFGLEHVPERSFIRSWFDERLPQIRARLRALSRAVVQGKTDTTTALELFGQWAVGDIQKRIAAGIDPPNAPATVARKGSSTPLIDTGQLRSAITYLVEQRLAVAGTVSP